MGLGDWLFGRGRQYRGVLTGLDTAGKTMLLYQLKLGKAILTIPTMGFNVETITHHSGSSFELWDVGGCDQMRRFIGNYITEETFVLFVHDCSDNQRLDESVEDLKSISEIARRAGSRYTWILLNKQDALSPDERESALANISDRFTNAAAVIHDDQIYIKILDLPGFSAEKGTQTNAMLDEIQKRLAGVPSSTSATRVAKTRDSRGPSIQGPTEKGLLERIQGVNAAAVSADDFWEGFVSGRLEVWDHYAHLRAGYFVMLELPLSGRGIFQCADVFIEHLERLRAMNPQRFRNTTHRTMTVFWIVQLFRAAAAYRMDKGLSSFPRRDQFGDVLSHSPHLMDTRNWAEYYSRDIMFSPEAKQLWQPPDLQPFPVTTGSLEPSPTTPAAPDDESERLSEFGFTVAQSAIKSGVRRGEVVKQALETLQTSTIRLRAAKPSVSPYSETKAYFWIQLASAALRSVADIESNDVVSAMSFAEFKRKSGFAGNEWEQYYSADLWESIAARIAFTNPDLRPLPNVIRADGR